MNFPQNKVELKTRLSEAGPYKPYEVEKTRFCGDCLKFRTSHCPRVWISGKAVGGWWLHYPGDTADGCDEYREVLSPHYRLKSESERVPVSVEQAKNPKLTEETMIVATEVGETFQFTGDRNFKGRVQITAIGRPVSRFMKLELRCTGDNEQCPCCIIEKQHVLDFEDTNLDPSAFATYFDTNNPRDALRVLVERGLKPKCSDWKQRTYSKSSMERAVTPAVVLDRAGVEGRAWFVHGPKCDLKRSPNWIVADGWLCRGSKGRIGILVKGFTTDSEINSPNANELDKAREILQSQCSTEKLEGSTVWKVAEALQRRSQLKGGEIVKGYVSDLLTWASPVWVDTIEGEPQLGATTGEIGPTTTAKSQRQREQIKWLETGKYEAGRLTRAGLTAGAEKVEGIGWVVRKGLLPSVDLNFLVLDNMPPHFLDDQIESRRNGVVSLKAMRGTELWSRCRLKLLSNPRNPFDETLYKCVALKVYDRKLIARFTFAVFTYGVSSEERYNSKVKTLNEESKDLLNAARTILRWNLSRETTYKIPASLWPAIMEMAKKLEDTYGCEDLPLLLRSIPYKLGVLMYSFALLEGVENPTKRHLILAKKWLEFCATDIELDKYVVQWKEMHSLTDAEYNRVKGELQEEIEADVSRWGGSVEESKLYKLIEYLAKNEKAPRDEVAAHLGCEPRTVTDKARLLKGLQLLRSDRNGYSFTAKGVRFVRKWFEERRPHS